MRSFDWKNIYCASAAGLAVALAQISNDAPFGVARAQGSVIWIEPIS